MEKATRTEWRCTSTELYLLAGLAGARALVGVADPFPGFLAEEVQATIEPLKQELQDQQVLVGTEGSLRIDATIYNWLQPVGNPSLVFWMTDSGRTAPWQGHVYVGDQLVVAKQEPGEDGRYQVFPLGTPQVAQTACLERFAIPAVAAGSFAETVISQAACEKAVALSAGGDVDALTACFLEAGVPDAHAAVLARSFALPAHLGQWVRMEPQNSDWTIRDLGFCFSEAGNWLLQVTGSGEQRSVQIRSVSGADAEQALADFLQVPESQLQA